MAEVILRNVSKIYQPGNVRAVSDLNLVVNDGEFLVLVGPSGCGKSTALRMIAGLEDISEGDILIDGVKVNNVSPKNRDIAMVFQNYALYPHMSVYENLAFGLKLRKISRKEIDTRVREAASILGLQDLLQRKPSALSGGQRQRVAVGRCIVRKPKVFLFDEPLSNLDAKMRVQMRAEICQLHARLKSTMIYVTHDQVEAMTMGTRIVVMKDGKVQQIDKPMNIYHKPSNAFVAGFIGTPPMNFFEASLQQDTLHVQDHALRLTKSDCDRIARHQLTNVTIGIRPQDFLIVNNREQAFIDSVINLVEPLGAETFIHCTIGEHKLVASTDPSRQFRIDQPVLFGVREDKINFFHPQTGEAL